MWMQKQCLSVCLNRRHTLRFSRILFPGRPFALWPNALRCFKLLRGRLFCFFFYCTKLTCYQPTTYNRHFYEQTFLLIADKVTGCVMQQLQVNDAADSRSPSATSAASLSARLCSLNDQTHYNDSPPTAPINLFRLPVKPKLALLNE